MVSFQKLVTSNGLYRIQVRTNIADNNGPFVSASIPIVSCIIIPPIKYRCAIWHHSNLIYNVYLCIQCELMRSGFREEIVLYTSPDGEKVVGMAYSSPVIALSRSCDASKVRYPHIVFI